MFQNICSTEILKNNCAKNKLELRLGNSGSSWQLPCRLEHRLQVTNQISRLDIQLS